ncbi:HCP-like protein [Pisolithus marmoratus]|nr:HCP-like protein [Pisolithus marmoratus]
MNLPSRPTSTYQEQTAARRADQPPPIPPHPPELVQSRSLASPHPPPSLPHFESPLVAPRPHRVDPNLPANMARTLDDQAAAFNAGTLPDPYRVSSPFGPLPSPPQHSVDYNPGGFTHLQQLPARRASAQPPLSNPNDWSPWSPVPSQPGLPPPSRQSYHCSSPNPARATMAYQQPSQQPHVHPRASSIPSYVPPKAPSPPRQANGSPALTAPLPSIQSLTIALPTVQQPTHDPVHKMNWARDVLLLVDRAQQNPSGDTPVVGPVMINDPQLQRLVQVAVPTILQLASVQTHTPPPAYVAEALFFRASFAASGAFPEHVQHNPRLAFRDFEAAARFGYAQAWFRLGRDYESFNDIQHARECFERGAKRNVESCIYRMGMAHLRGQLGLPAQPEVGVSLLHRAATLATIQVPNPAYVYGLLLLDEFAHASVPQHLFAPFIPPQSTVQHEARLHLERAAFLHFAPAQYKLGHAYEFATPPFPFDPLLSVQYYSLASQQGEVEADMALSKWFLCGAEGAFEKDEHLAYTFAEKAARKGLPSAEFAMGYYKEVGVGGPKDVNAAISWYQLASDHGNADAADRLAALQQPSPQVLSRQEHDHITEDKLVRKRTQAKQRSERASADGGFSNPRPSLEDGQRVVDLIRRDSIARPAVQDPQSPPAPAQGMPAIRENVTPASVNAGTHLPQGARQFPNQHRYTLVDPGSASPGGPPPPRTQSPTYARPAGRPPAQRTASAPSQGGILQNGSEGSGGVQPPSKQRPAAAKGPTTFAEMGIQGARLEGKECMIM